MTVRAHPGAVSAGDATPTLSDLRKDVRSWQRR
jgi:hypothetical protein